ncbi:MAG: hypothetical protein NC548_41980 [Lachnospiraceae bacterium]|nr:hypothetical protein [Lachnospiraceae bacterium]
MEKATRPDLNKLALEVHANAVQHGFWEGDPSATHCLCLVVCELAEAVEADRKGERADRCGFSAMLCDWTDPEKQQDPEQYAYEFQQAFRYDIKDTVEDELADAVIRLLDLAGLYGHDLNNGGAVISNISSKHKFTENVWLIVRDLTTGSTALTQRMRAAIIELEMLAATYDIDLWWHVQQKMQYNKFRPYMHGKKY